jgi:ABC-2 type transport system permease protein
MNSPSSSLPDSFGSQAITPPTSSATRPFYWSVRRALWEYRSIYIAPLAAAGVAMFGFLISLISLPRTVQAMAALDPAQQHKALAHPYDMVAGLIMMAAFIVSIFYSLDALYGERRDRSILFWKSLPVSDLTTVLAKASIPMVILQLLSFAIAAATLWIMLLLSSAVVLGSGGSVAAYWGRLSLFRMLLMLLYHLVTVHMLWYAPLYAWLILVSAWARRTPFLWAVLPPFAIAIFEKIAFRSSHFTALLQYRIGVRQAVGSMQDNFPIQPGMPLAAGRFLSSPGLWTGLIVAAIFIAAAVRLRHYREPI